MPSFNDPDRWARLRFAIIAPLLAAPPPRGTLRGELEALAQKIGRHYYQEGDRSQPALFEDDDFNDELPSF